MECIYCHQPLTETTSPYYYEDNNKTMFFECNQHSLVKIKFRYSTLSNMFDILEFHTKKYIIILYPFSKWDQLYIDEKYSDTGDEIRSDDDVGEIRQIFSYAHLVWITPENVENKIKTLLSWS